MKKLRRALLPLLTLALIAAGAVMPYAACRLQDSRLVGGSEDRSFDSVSLTLRQEGGIGETARLLSGPYSIMEWSGETAMTAAEALEAGMKALESMKQAGLIPTSRLNLVKKLDSGGSMPLLAVSEDGERSSLLWQCWWTVEDEEERTDWYLLVEDATGLAVEASVGSALYAGKEAPYAQMDSWVNFFQDYYGIQIPAVQDNSPDADRVWQFLMPFDPQDGQGKRCALVLTLYDGVSYFTFLDPGWPDAEPAPPEDEVIFDAGSMQKR